MSTNYYLFTRDIDAAETLKASGLTVEPVTEPVLGFAVHIGKKSIGNRPLFAIHACIHSLDDVLRVVDSLPPNCAVYDEYGDIIQCTEFHSLTDEWKRQITDNEVVPLDWKNSIAEYTDDVGFAFTSRDYS